MIWEVAGESGAGKTQLALHLSLMIQLPERLGGLSGSTCYLTTSSSLQTERLIELINSHPQLSSAVCGLEAIHTMPCPTIPLLLHILRETLPPFIEQQSHSEPVKLLVIDALGELFHTTDKTTKRTLVERSIDIAQISGLLHSIASTHNIAIVVLNEVVDTFDRGFIDSDEDHLSYSDQARWFSRAKGGKPGLVWANQVNVRIQMSRTGRRRYLNDFESMKRQKQHQNTAKSSRDTDDQTTLIRRLSVIFSSVAPPAYIDYIVTPSALFGIPEEGAPKPPSNPLPPFATAAAVCPLSTQVPPLDRGFDDDDLEPSNDSWDLGGLLDSEETGDIS
ncbi:P-loop containing nucleoside triphosphate hydrolase protein [Hymenopellis radicata]|nr:P-loop containing nucleoside triphosphate hydrolase protein [Hymenopellis radicata]